ncbi:MAG: thrombospondin type 3 repeat-containing protein [Sandaracinaceae bacterium]|nr:thrombospondin type 3 repeat-containing protein [Sandaracinaceae bacterium]
MRTSDIAARVRRQLVLWRLVALALGSALFTSPALAEGSLGMGAELAPTQALRATTNIFVDVINPAVETFVWTGKGSVTVSDPLGATVGTFASGATITPTMSGSYKLDLLENQFDVDGNGGLVAGTQVPWDVTLFVSGTPRDGRVYSFAWGFNTGGFNVASATNASFYARVPGGDSESFAVMELRTDGLAGFIFEVQGNSTGVRGPNAGRSVPEVGNSAANEYQMYLNPPDDATYSFLGPQVRDFSFRGGLETSGGVPACDEFVSGDTRGEFTFTSNVVGSFHLVCDLNRDGRFDIVDSGDFLFLGAAVAGENRVAFDGLDNRGNPFPVGDHQCSVRLTVGEFHYVGRDIETSFRGLRMFQVGANGSLTPLNMFWNDALVQANATVMPAPFPFVSASTSGPNGLNSGDPMAPPVPLGETVVLPNANSRAWGDFVAVGGSGTGKGNEAFLDTYTWLAEDVSTPITIHSVDGAADSDMDGLTDYVERCTTGTLVNNADSDGDGVNDFIETRGGMPNVNTDGDLLVNALDDDDDGDCVPTVNEDPDGDGDPTNDDSDMDTRPNYLDADDDGDGIGPCDEDTDGDGDPTNDDADMDGVPNYLTSDSDGDCALRATVPSILCVDNLDQCPLEPEDANNFMDTDGCPEPDRDMDGVPDAIDNCPDIPNADQADLNDDDEGDVCDDDIDGDGLLNICEIPVTDMCPLVCRDVCGALASCDGCAATDPRVADTDEGGLGDGEEVMRGGDPLNPVDDPLPGVLSGGGVYTCAAGHGRSPLASLFLLTCLGLALLRRAGGRR